MAPHKSRNYEVTGGIMRFSKNRMYKKRALYRIKKSPLKGIVDSTMKETAKKMVVKKISGEKNGKTRTVRIKRMSKFYPTEDYPKRKKPLNQRPFCKHTHKVRQSISPGTILILLAGLHKGKRVVYLKQLDTGLLLVSGPFKMNGCPLRRISQRYVIATQTKIDISSVKIPENLNDGYFKRKNSRSKSKKDDQILVQKEEEYKLTDERKKDQLNVDKQLIDAIKKQEHKKLIFGYLSTTFSLSTKDYPHRMVF